MSSDDGSHFAEIPERRWPRRAALGVLAAGGAAAVTSPWWLQLLGDDPKEKKLPTSDNFVVLHPKEMMDLYVKWLKICVEAKQQNPDKPLYIIAAEHHDDQESFLFQMMLTDIAQRLGLPNRFVEYDQGRLDQFQKGVSEGKALRIAGNIALNLEMEKRGQLIPMDLPLSEELLKNKYGTDEESSLAFSVARYKTSAEREKQMIDTMLEHKEGGLAIAGYTHVSELISDMKKSGANVVAFSTYCDQKLNLQAEREERIMRQLKKWATTAEQKAALQWDAKETEQLRNLKNIAVMAPDKVLTSRVRNNREMLLLTAKAFTQSIDKIVGDLNPEQDMKQIEHRFADYVREMEAKQRQGK